MNQLIHFDKAKYELSLATKIDEIKEIRDKAEALRAYTKQVGESLEMQNQCAEIKIRAERRAGELIPDMKEQGKRTDLTSLHNESKLKEAGISESQSHRWQTIAKMPEEDFEKHIAETKDNGEELTSVGIYRAAKQDTIATKWTGDPESYTPSKYIESARRVMGSIDVDPASDESANQAVKAHIHYTKKTNGLDKSWNGSIFLNPPYSQPDIRLFIDKLLQEIKSGNTKQAVLLTNNNTDTRWFADAANAATGICFTLGRINFYKPDNTITQPTNGQAFFYFGNNLKRFADEFKQYGLIYTLYEFTSDD